MPVYRADRESLLLQSDIPGCIRSIALAPLDPRQPRRKIRREEQADEAYAMRGRKTLDFCPFRFQQIDGIEYDRTALGEHTHAVLSELGYLPAEIDELQAAQAVLQSDRMLAIDA